MKLVEGFVKYEVIYLVKTHGVTSFEMNEKKKILRCCVLARNKSYRCDYPIEAAENQYFLLIQPAYPDIGLGLGD